MWVGGQRHVPAALPLGKTRYPSYRRLGGSQSRSGQVRKISPPPGIDPWTAQPIASRYTDWAVPAPENAFYSSKITYGQSRAKLKSGRQGWVYQFIDCEDSNFVGCDVTRRHRNVSTFQRNRLLHCQLPSPIKAADFFQTLLHAFQTTWLRTQNALRAVSPWLQINLWTHPTS